MLVQAVRSREKLDIMQQGIGIPGLIENLKTLQTKCLFNMVWNQGKYSSLIRSSLFVFCFCCLLHFLVWLSKMSGCFHYFSLILQNDIRPYKVDEMTFIVPYWVIVIYHSHLSYNNLQQTVINLGNFEWPDSGSYCCFFSLFFLCFTACVQAL